MKNQLTTANNRMRRRSARRGGSVMIMVMGATVVLLGVAALVIDYSVLLRDRNQLQNGVDASALAGAAWLQRTGDDYADSTNVKNQAVAVARANGLAADEISTADIEILDNATKIRVNAYRNRGLFLMRVFGKNSSNINARAEAGLAGRTTPKVIPVGITTQTFDAFSADPFPRELTLNNPQATDFMRTDTPTYDPFVLTDFLEYGDGGTKGSSGKMSQQLAGDARAKETVKIGDVISSIVTDTQVADFEAGIGTLFNRAAAGPWYDPASGVAATPWQTVGTQYENVQNGSAPANNPRVVSVFVTESLPLQTGDFSYPVRGFAPVYIESVSEVGGVVKLHVRFLNPTSSFGSQPVKLMD